MPWRALIIASAHTSGIHSMLETPPHYVVICNARLLEGAGLPFVGLGTDEDGLSVIQNAATGRAPGVGSVSAWLRSRMSSSSMRTRHIPG